MSKIEFDKKIVYVAGLPRSGSTLVCQLLDQHPDICSPGHSSPLAHIIDAMRTTWSNDAFLLSQLDVDFELVYRRLSNAYQGVACGWFAETDLPTVVDKNRAWLGMVETVMQITPDFHMLVMIRELSQLYGSIESQHQKTQFLDSGDRTAGMSRYGRASAFFNGDGLVARSLAAVQSAIEDLPETAKERIMYVQYERLVEAPVEVMAEIYERIGIAPAPFDPAKLTIRPAESDSHYRYKYPHSRRECIAPPAPALGVGPDSHWLDGPIRMVLPGLLLAVSEPIN